MPYNASQPRKYLLTTHSTATNVLLSTSPAGQLGPSKGDPMNTTLDAIFARRANEMPGFTPWVTLVVKDGEAVYTLEASDRPDLPFTHMVTGRHGTTYGYWTEHSGRSVRIPRSGWTSQRGVLGVFSTRDQPVTMYVKGWAHEPHSF